MSHQQSTPYTRSKPRPIYKGMTTRVASGPGTYRCESQIFQLIDAGRVEEAKKLYDAHTGITIAVRVERRKKRTRVKLRLPRLELWRAHV